VALAPAGKALFAIYLIAKMDCGVAARYVADLQQKNKNFLC
jgi:hypothetical protein